MPRSSKKKRTQPQPPRWVSVPFAAIRGLHPAIASLSWLGPEYFLNDLRGITPNAVTELLRTHPPVLCLTGPVRRKSDGNMSEASGHEAAAAGQGPAGADAQADEDKDDVDSDDGSSKAGVDPNRVHDAGPEAETATAALPPRAAPVGRKEYFVVGGLRSWQVAAAVYARSMSPPRRGLSWIPALVVPREPEEAVVAHVRAERYLDQLLHCLKPASASRQLAETWTEFIGQNAIHLCNLTPDFTSQEKLISSLGYSSRSAFRRPPHKGNAITNEQDPGGTKASTTTTPVNTTASGGRDAGNSEEDDPGAEATSPQASTGDRRGDGPDARAGEAEILGRPPEERVPSDAATAADDSFVPSSPCPGKPA